MMLLIAILQRCVLGLKEKFSWFFSYPKGYRYLKVIPMLAIDGKHKELYSWLEGKQSPICFICHLSSHPASTRTWMNSTLTAEQDHVLKDEARFFSLRRDALINLIEPIRALNANSANVKALASELKGRQNDLNEHSFPRNEPMQRCCMWPWCEEHLALSLPHVP